MSWIRKQVFNLFYKSMLRNTTHRFSCGTNAGRFLFGNKTFTVVPNAIDTGKFQFNPEIRKKLRNSLGIPEDIKVYGHVGTFRTPKNHSFLIDVFAELHKSNPATKLVLVGSGELLDKIKAKVLSLGLNDAVAFMGQQNNVNEWLSAFDVFLMPSLWEGLPVSVVEAQCAGLPCVISDVIDRGVDITGNVKFVSTNMPAVFWADIISAVNSTHRIEMGEIVANSPYNIDNAVSELANFYNKNSQD